MRGIWVGAAVAATIAASASASASAQVQPTRIGNHGGYANAPVVTISGGNHASRLTLGATLGNRRLVHVTELGGPMVASSSVLANPNCLVVLLLAQCNAAKPLVVHADFQGHDDVVDARALPRLSADGWRLGAGDDTFHGGASDDIVEPGPGNDVISGGEGNDLADWSNLDQPLRITLDGIADDGPDGRGNVLPDVERVTGSRAPDVLVGNAGRNLMQAGPFSGGDLVQGLGGDDGLSIDAGGLAEGGEGADVITLRASAGPASGSGGSGPDRIDLVDTPAHAVLIDGGDGDDLVDLRSKPGGDLVTISCGDGHDRVVRHAGGVTIAADCEEVVAGF